MAELDPSNPEQLGEFLHHEHMVARLSRGLTGGTEWTTLGRQERATWVDLASAVWRRFAVNPNADRLVGSINEEGC